jgi:hypothetical protein
MHAIFAVALLLSVPEIVRADVIKLANGSEIDGTIVEQNDKEIVVEVMGGDGGFRKKRITLDRSQLAGVEELPKPPENFIDALLQGWNDPTGRGKRTILSYALIPFLLPAVALFVLSLILKRRPNEFWKALLTAFVTWGLAAALVFLLFESGKDPAIAAGTAAVLIIPFLSALVIYRERPLRALLFPAVQACSMMLAYLALKYAVPTT